MEKTHRRRSFRGLTAVIGTGLLPAAVAVFALFSSPGSTASACTPPPGGNPQKTVADRVAAADITIEGTIVALEGETPIQLQVAKISVAQYIAGGGPALVTVSRFGPGGLCLSEVTLGQHALFYIDETPTGLQAFYLTQFDAVAPADPATLAEAIDAAGHAPSPPDPATRARAILVALDNPADPPATAEATGASGSSPGWALAGLGMTALASVGLVAVRARPNRRE